MSFGSTIFIAIFLVATSCVTASAFAKRPGDAWNYYHFDGRAFMAGQRLDGGRFVALRERMMPVVVTGTAKIEPVALAHGKGAIAGICYIRNSGGKLTSSSGYTPVPQTPLRIFSGSRLVTTIQTDEQGYFTALLDSGRYTIESGAMQIDVLVDKGITILVPIRIGKRMVD